MSEVPEDLRYTENNDWIRKEDGDIYRIGITDHAQEQLTDIVQVYDLPEVGAEVSKGDVLATLESVKASTEVYAPMSGTVVEVNSSLEDSPDLLNSEPYGQAWIVALKSTDAANYEALMDPGKYRASIE